MKLSNIVEPVTTAGRVFALVIQTLIVLSLVAFCIETLPGLSARTQTILDRFELVSVIIFSAEYVLRLIAARPRRSYAFSFLGIVDLVAILPFYLASGIDLRSIRILRMFRLIRVFKLLRYSQAARRFADSFALIRAELALFLVACLFLLFISSVGIYYFENEAQPEVFASVFHCMWWAVETLTTVGYGDAFPVTAGGRVFTAFVVVIGLGIVAVPAGLVAGALSQTLGKEARMMEAEKNEASSGPDNGSE